MTYKSALASLTIFAALLTSSFVVCAMPRHYMAMDQTGYMWLVADDCFDNCPLVLAANSAPFEKFSKVDPRQSDFLNPRTIPLVVDLNVVQRTCRMVFDGIFKPPELARSDGLVGDNLFLVWAYSQGILNPKIYPNV